MRVDGYAPIRDYAVIGDGRTCALVARDGAIDWLCLPNVDSPSTFGAILDARRGGSFVVQPDEPFESERRYRRDSNVLETTFRTPSGSVRLTDALAVSVPTALSPLREVVRRVEGLSGSVRLRWHVEPRFEFGRVRPRTARRAGRLIFERGAHALAVGAFGAGEQKVVDGRVSSSFTLDAGAHAVIHLAHAFREPLVLVGPGDAEESIEATDAFWREWTANRKYDGPYRAAVIRSALALKLLVFAPSGAVVAAPTTSLPERIGGERNWDYRYSWVRDATWTLNALLGLGCGDEARAFFWWLMHASRTTLPRLRVLYRVDGDAYAPEREIGVEGYRGSRPVRTGNGALDQLQLDIYGALIDGAWRYAEAGHAIDRRMGKDLARIADHVVEIWRRPDSGIWEPRVDPVHHTQSKAMCWLALDRAAKLAEAGHVPDRRERWEAAAADVRAFYETHGWSDEQGSYVCAPEVPEVDASLLTMSLLGCEDAAGARMRGTIDAVRRELADGALVYRYRREDGLEGREGAFVACSFWLVSALARAGCVGEAASLMEELLELANDVGLYSEEIDPASGDFLGNFPQGLSHLALINAAFDIGRASS